MTTRAFDRYRQVSFVVPAVVLLVLLTAPPLYQVISMSLHSYADSNRPVFAWFSNFGTLATDPRFLLAVVQTLVYTFGSVALSLVLGVGAAVLLNNQQISTRVRGVFRSLLMFPWLFSSAVVASIWALMLNPFGIVNSFLNSVGLKELSTTAWLSDERFAMLSLVITNVWRGFPFIMLMALAALQTVPSELREAAQVDGAGAVRTFWSIVLPQIKGVLLTVALLETVWNFRAFDLTYLMTGGGPIHATETVSLYAYQVAYNALDFGYASAMGIVLLLIMSAVSIVYIRQTMKEV